MIQHLKRSLYFIGGLTSLVLGIIGVFVPLLPTTPFVLLAAFCFARCSPRLHQWLIRHRTFGPLIVNWQEYGAIARRVKWVATLSMLLMVSYPIGFMIQPIPLKLLVSSCIALILLFIWSRPEVTNTPHAE